MEKYSEDEKIILEKYRNKSKEETMDDRKKIQELESKINNIELTNAMKSMKLIMDLQFQKSKQKLKKDIEEFMEKKDEVKDEKLKNDMIELCEFFGKDENWKSSYPEFIKHAQLVFQIKEKLEKK